jgi:class 3 adenylate cyclase
MSADAAFRAVREALRKGECLHAYDLAEHALAEHKEHVGLRHRAVLALARAGAPEHARARFQALGLNDVHTEEVTSLDARLWKDLAFTARGAEREPLFARSIEAYEKAYAISNGYYPAINIATLSLLAGRRAAAEEWAKIALSLAEGGAADDYYAIATRAEALLLLARVTETEAALDLAIKCPSTDEASRATTRRQLGRIVDVLGLSPTVLSAINPRAVMHYCGHIVAPPGAAGRFPADQADDVARRSAAFFNSNLIGRAFGSLAAGADIIIAEAALAAGVELEVVFPFAQEEFVAVSVAPAAADWKARFEACLKAASHVHFVTEEAYLGDDALFGYTTEYALGLAKLHAASLDAPLQQLAVWDGVSGPPGARAGTAHDLELARNNSSIKQEILAVQSNLPAAGSKTPSNAANEDKSSRVQRKPKTMLFGDFKGFSKLDDAQLPIYVRKVLGAVAKVLDTDSSSLAFRNTWGDGIFLVFENLVEAVGCAFRLQAAISEAVDANPELPKSLGLRLGIHYGPVYETLDPILKRNNYFGFHVSRAARVEPVTPEGVVYATDQTAAAIALAASDRYGADYVGRIPLAKNYGAFRMYRLRQK